MEPKYKIGDRVTLLSLENNSWQHKEEYGLIIGENYEVCEIKGIGISGLRTKTYPSGVYMDYSIKATPYHKNWKDKMGE